LHNPLPLALLRYHLDQFWRALSFNHDSSQLEYISTIEARNYPFVGTQFHPEKNIFEWALNTVKNIPHSR
jgi:gamma-glutamyl hydrolase